MPDVIANGWAAFMTSLTAALTLFFAAIPRVLGFLLIMIIGWFISGLLASGVAALLRMVRFNELAQRSGVTGFINRMGVRRDSAGFLADVAKWFVRLIVLVVAFDALGLPAVSEILQQFLLWIPNLVVAVVVLVLTGLAANALSDVVRGASAQAQLGNPKWLANITEITIWVFGIVIAANQIGIASTLVNTLFMGFVFALALAAGLAFGLGGRDTASDIVRTWYRRGQEAAPRLEQAAENVERRLDPQQRPGQPQPVRGIGDD
jgi:hypothetical protein